MYKCYFTTFGNIPQILRKINEEKGKILNIFEESEDFIIIYEVEEDE